MCPAPRKQQHDAVRRGRVAEFLAAAWLLHHLNAYVAIPPDPNDTDLLLQIEEGEWRSIQVKSTFTHDENLVANVTKSNGERYKTDYMLIVDTNDGDATFWLIPTKDITEKSRIILTNYADYYMGGFNEPPTQYDGKPL